MSEIKRCGDYLSKRLSDCDSEIAKKANTGSTEDLTRRVESCEANIHKVYDDQATLRERVTRTEVNLRWIQDSVDKLKEPSNLVAAPSNQIQRDGIDDGYPSNIEEEDFNGRTSATKAN